MDKKDSKLGRGLCLDSGKENEGENREEKEEKRYDNLNNLDEINENNANDEDNNYIERSKYENNKITASGSNKENKML